MMLSRVNCELSVSTGLTDTVNSLEVLGARKSARGRHSSRSATVGTALVAVRELHQAHGQARPQRSTQLRSAQLADSHEGCPDGQTSRLRSVSYNAGRA